MGFFSEVADFFDYMVNGENSASAARMRTEREELERKKHERFEKELPDGTTIYGPKGFDRKDKSNYHGHRGENFDRSPHSTIGSAAIGDAHTYNEHKNNRTKRG